MIETAARKEKFVLAAVSDADPEDAAASLEELSLLVDTAGGETAASVVQNLDHPNPATYLGSGKLKELKELIILHEADGIVCDDELSPAQMKNLESELEVRVLDRTMVILDIFAARASSSEGKIQVELAQLRYRANRLVGTGLTMSRQGGAGGSRAGGRIGTRGPGESKLETDRRGIRARIGQLKAELEQVKRTREITRRKRNDSHIPVAAIVGYTNAGKSTLLNKLTGASVLAEDKLFATLDPTTRLLNLENNEPLLLTDTVGFINKLPHNLVDAFRSTLEEAKFADFIIHVIDASDPHADIHMKVVYDTLKELGADKKKVVTLMNKQDKVSTDGIIRRDFNAVRTISTSLKTGEGLDELKEVLSGILRSEKQYVERLYGYDEMSKIQLFRKYGQILNEEYRGDGIFIAGYVPKEYYSQTQ